MCLSYYQQWVTMEHVNQDMLTILLTAVIFSGMTSLICLIPVCRLYTKWSALWSWWRWMRMAWHQSNGWTGSSARWIRTTMTRSHWMSSRRQQRVIRPLCFSCNVTCKSERDRLHLHTLDSSTRFNVSLSSQPFPQEKKICLDYFSMDSLLVVVCMRMSIAESFWI